MGLSYDPQATARTFKRWDRIIQIDQEILALRTERSKLVRENEADEWLSQGQRWRGKVVSLKQYRNNMRFRIRHQPISHAA